MCVQEFFRPEVLLNVFYIAFLNLVAYELQKLLLVTCTIKNLANLRNVFQPPSERDEHEQHRRRVEEGHWRGVLLHDHGGYDHAHGVSVRNRGGQHHENVHVGCPVSDGGKGSAVEVTTPDKL